MFLKTARRPRGQSRMMMRECAAKGREVMRNGEKRQKIGGRGVILDLGSDPLIRYIEWSHPRQRIIAPVT